MLRRRRGLALRATEGRNRLLVLVAVVTLVGAGWRRPRWQILGRRLLGWLDPVSGGLVLGTTMAAMLLGHWYLNSPGMKLQPLGRLIGLLAAAVLLRAVLSAGGPGWKSRPPASGLRWWFFLACVGWLAWWGPGRGRHGLADAENPQYAKRHRAFSTWA